MLEHIIIHCAPNIGGKTDEIQKKIYDFNLIPVEDLNSFIKRDTLPQKKILIYKQVVYPNLLFE